MAAVWRPTSEPAPTSSSSFNSPRPAFCSTFPATSSPSRRASPVPRHLQLRLVLLYPSLFLRQPRRSPRQPRRPTSAVARAFRGQARRRPFARPPSAARVLPVIRVPFRPAPRSPPGASRAASATSAAQRRALRASLALSDPRGYASRRELARRVESLAVREAELVAALCEGDRSAPLAEITASGGVLPRERSGSEVWQLPGSAAAVVCWASEASLLPRLAAWDRSEALAARIAYAIEGQMQGCAFTLGLGEPNLAGKPVLEYDRVVRPHELHALKPKPAPEPKSGYRNRENETLFTMYQILESWLRAASQLLTRLNERIEAKNWEAAASDCWILERVWKLLADVEDLHMLMDPDDFLRLKSQLAIRAAPGSDASFCFRSRALLHVANTTRDLKKRVPWVLGVEVDPNGGPRVQEAAMRLYHSPRRGDGEEAGKVELLQASQAETAASFPLNP
ncbi:Nematode resistance protein-like HSPRO2 [Dichanthelium oligosanthes]|uniref:Nematode resistance protein-like HSPRO2 n=1 Tax=Dichanthelium oligosanthes TaxID=888268 RepID=A0A1E5VN68_9POAL|nr:Nematode resistance protein-like HSPRO2 [Dichanthelium oligosanthes]